MPGHFRKGRKAPKKSAALSVFLFIGLFLGTSGIVYLYCTDPGLKYFKNYSSEDYVSQPQNWCIIQNSQGIIYAANSGGILNYDGASWNSIMIPNQLVRSLTIDGSGVIYVGGVNEIGFLASSWHGKPTYKSLLGYIDESKRNFGYVWRTHAIEERIYFRTTRYLFRWDTVRKQMNTWEPEKGEGYKFNASFTCGGKYFINQFKVGLMQLVEDSLEIIPEGQIFAHIKTPFMMVPFDNSGQKILIGTREEGFFIYDGQTVQRYAIEIEDYLKEKRVSHGIKLSHSPDQVAMATLRGGLVITDLRGKLKYLFTKESGLHDNNVKYVFEDVQGNLWAALDKGISKIEYLSPLSVFNEAHSNLAGLVYSVTRNSNGLYAGTSQGLFQMTSKNIKFRSVHLMPSACWSLLSIGNSVLAATDVGVFQLQNNKPRKITDIPSYVLLQSAQYPGRIWVGMRNTLGVLYQKPDQEGVEWEEEYRYKNINQEVRTIVEDQEGNLWLGSRAPGILKVVFPGDRDIGNVEVINYDSSHKVPKIAVQVFWAARHVMFGTKGDLFCFDRGKNHFVPDDTLEKDFSNDLRDIYRLVEDKNNSIWFHAYGRNYQAIPGRDGVYKIKKKPLARIPIAAQVNFIYPDPIEDIIWFATHKGLICFDHRIKKDYDNKYNTIIRRVLVNGGPRFFDYHQSPDALNINREVKHHIPVLNYNERNIRFEFAAPFFEDEIRTTYFCRLEGYDKEWIQLHRESFKDYTHLDAGAHTFRVKAKNVYGNMGREAVFKFKIQPPWYNTWWAYLSYIGLFLLTILLTFKWRSGQLRREKKRLEQIVNKRTKEIKQKNRQLEKQTALLQEQAEKLKELDHAKSRFFANISHEFRTPLTLIIGPLEHILSRSLPEEIRERLNLMHRNSHRLQTLINRLLDLSRIDSGKMKLKAAPHDIISFLKGIIAVFEQLIRQNKLDLEFRAPAESIILYFDTEKLEEVFCNLLTNAVKFTPGGGKITVSINKVMEKEEDPPTGFVEISVRDTGIGIPKEQLGHIFDRFFQVESHERKHKGSGIGLALSRELVTLHHGKIDVNSRVGENSGSEFILRFPLGKDHLKTEEIASPLETEYVSPRSEQGKNGFDVEQKFCGGPGGGFSKKPPGRRRQEKSSFTADIIDEEQIPGRETVLVVEDNPDMRQFIRESIGERYNIEEAGDGREGIRKARHLMPDLIISDIMMPEVDGYELCQKLKKDIKTSHIPIILLTAKASEESRVQGLEIGADDYITKPFNEKILLVRIKNLINLRRELQDKFQRQMVLQPAEIQVSSIDQRFLQKLQETVEEYLPDPDLNVEALSEKMEISRVTLNKKILALIGETATEFIRSYRLKRAMQLLKENFGTVLDIAMEVGFSSSAYFTKCFREKFHQLPSAFLGKES